MPQVFVLVGLVSLGKYLPDAEADNMDSWKACLYKRLNGVRAFDRPVPLLLVREIQTCSALGCRTGCMVHPESQRSRIC